ncbi:MAG: carbon-nitrogen hydrolase family protein, partial [Candidatus Saccharibacteria bacterium]
MKNLFQLILMACLMLLSTAGVKAAGPASHNVRVVSLCFPNKGLDEIARVVEEEAYKGCDIIVLPETWRGQSHPETLEGETITTLAKLALKHHTYILSPIDRTDGKQRLNSAVLIDRNGKVAFVYDKIYPYWGEFDLSPAVTPGTNTSLVCDTDFGRIGVATCYDANFPEVWQQLREQGAQMVLWPSAYSAGTQLQAYALLHHYYIVTSTQS